MEWFEEDELAKSIYEIMQAEMDLEATKRNLALQTDFNVQDCFSLFDCSKTGMITRMDFEEVLNLLELYPQVIEIELAMARYDADGDGKLSYDEFKEIISKTTLHKKIPFPLDTSDFVKLYFGKERERSVSYVEFSQFLHDFHDEYAMVGFKAKDKTEQVRNMFKIIVKHSL